MTSPAIRQTTVIPACVPVADDPRLSDVVTTEIYPPDDRPWAIEAIRPLLEGETLEHDGYSLPPCHVAIEITGLNVEGRHVHQSSDPAIPVATLIAEDKLLEGRIFSRSLPLLVTFHAPKRPAQFTLLVHAHPTDSPPGPTAEPGLGSLGLPGMLPGTGPLFSKCVHQPISGVASSWLWDEQAIVDDERIGVCVCARCGAVFSGLFAEREVPTAKESRYRYIGPFTGRQEES